MADRRLVSLILHHLSDMKYKDRRQQGPDQPVELLEFRPTLVPSILVNKMWANEGTSILWKRYPHLPALRNMDLERRQYYANKVHRIFSLSLSHAQADTLDYLDELEWPNLTSLEVEVDFIKHGAKYLPMLHPGLGHLELSGVQTGGAIYFTDVVLRTIFSACPNLQGLRFGPNIFPDDEPVHASALYPYLEQLSSIEVRGTGFASIDSLFTRLSLHKGLEDLEIDLEPGLALLPLIEGPASLPSPFHSLKRLVIMCYPEIALALLPHLKLIEELQLDICRIPDQEPHGEYHLVIEHLITRLSKCPRLRVLRVGLGALTFSFPSSVSLPRLSGQSLTELAKSCPILEDIKLFAIEPSALDGSLISSEDFDTFCKSLPKLQRLSLKLHPTTATALAERALLSLGENCPNLEVLRLKIPLSLMALPVPAIVPHIMVSAPGTPATEEQFWLAETAEAQSDAIAPLFLRLTHLALARPERIHTVTDESYTASSPSFYTATNSEDEEDIVRSWAHRLLTHFPRLQTLEAWGDWSGQDNESLNYFLPMEEILASTWEFLNGVEQDIWEDNDDDEEEEQEVGSWQTYESGDDWEAAASLNEYTVDNDAPWDTSFYEDEPEDTITPGRTTENADYFGFSQQSRDDTSR